MKNFKKLLAFAIMGLLVFAATATMTSAMAATEVAVTKTASPSDIFIQGAASPDSTTITLSVQGFGGTITETLPIDVVFAIDSSGSMTISDPSNLRIAAAKSLVDNLDSTRDQAGVVSWDDDVDFTFGLTQDFTTLKTNIDNVDAFGATNLDAGLAAAVAMLDANTRVGASTKAIIFLTDGIGTYTPASSPGPAQDAANKGYVIYSIALGASASAAPLIDMATATGGQFFDSPSAENLADIFDAILQTIVTNTSPSDVSLVETTQDYIVSEGSFSIAPDSIVTLGGGQTQMTWNNIAQYVGNNDNRLSADETFIVTFEAGSSLAGNDLPVDDLAESSVDYTNPDGSSASVSVPQAFINVQGPPVAVDDSASTLEDTPVTIDVLANDSDPNGDALTVISTTPPLHGSVVINVDNTVTYTPDPTIFDDTDTFTYTIDDGHGLTATATVTVDVASLPSTPGKVTAGQANLDLNTNAGFNVQSSDGTSFKGQLQFNDKLEDINLHSESMTALAIDPSGTVATFKGTAEVNGDSGYTFKVIVEDHGEPGTSDTFLIVIKDPTNTTIYMRDGTLSGGNIQIH